MPRAPGRTFLFAHYASACRACCQCKTKPGYATHDVYQNGKLFYHGCRQEVTGGVYELSGPDVEYTYFPEPEGVPDAFLRALDAAGVVHKLKPL